MRKGRTRETALLDPWNMKNGKKRWNWSVGNWMIKFVLKVPPPHELQRSGPNQLFGEPILDPPNIVFKVIIDHFHLDPTYTPAWWWFNPEHDEYEYDREVKPWLHNFGNFVIFNGWEQWYIKIFFSLDTNAFTNWEPNHVFWFFPGQRGSWPNDPLKMPLAEGIDSSCFDRHGLQLWVCVC